MLKNRQASEQQKKNTTEQIFKLRILSEKYLQHQQDLDQVFIDFKKSFSRVWHKRLYDKATSAVLFNSSIGDWFRTTVGVRQGCLLSPTLVVIFLERIMTDA